MTKRHKSRSGSLQFWPRKRARKILPSANWTVLKKDSGLMGFICYKVGMISVYARDLTEDSMTKTKKIVFPGTIVECPEMKIYSVRFYKNGKVMKDFVVGFDDELKRKVRNVKVVKKIEDVDFDDVRVIVYSDVKKTGIKKTPDIIELGLGGSKEDKLNFIKEKIGKSISVSEIFSSGLVDVRGVTKGFGLQGPVKRFGIHLKASKSEKGQRRPGSLAPWNPSRVTFKTAMAGQTGFQTRIVYNNLILQVGKGDEINKDSGFHKYGKIRTDYLILRGSIPGVKKRALLLTLPIRKSRKQFKKKFEVLELR